MSEVKTYAVNCNDAWLNTDGDDISGSYVKYADYMAIVTKLEAKDRMIAELEAKLDSADKLQDSAFRHGLQHGFSFGQTDNQAGFEECLSAYGARGKDNG